MGRGNGRGNDRVMGRETDRGMARGMGRGMFYVQNCQAPGSGPGHILVKVQVKVPV